MTPSGIALASRNAGKLAELRALSGGRLDLVAMPTDPEPPEVEEDGDTYEANALAKARAVARHVRGPALADDSGLEVDALDGRPGVWSARYGGEGLDDAGRCRRLLEEIGDRGDRAARFVCVLALVDGDREVVARGVLDGEIARAPRGASGFGYDPVFVPAGLGGRTFAEATAEEKNRISHRARAMGALLDRLASATR
ncbi:MAG: RdgB/HAM1 family non-canonical purine NTP pyrophosphatase [Alphaproteobacteria bacterium]